MPGTGTGEMTLEDYRAACEERTAEESWRAGQIDYPGRMSLDLGSSATYQAAVDIRDEPLPPEQVIDASSPKSRSVLVRCILSARLESVGAGLEVTGETEGLGGWQARDFSPSGVTQWTWTVKAAEPGDHELKLTLRPITTERDLVNDVGVEQKSFTTAVSVDASVVQDLAHWIDTQGAALKTIFGGTFLLLFGAGAYLVKGHDQVKELRARFGRKRPPPVPAGKAADTAPDNQPDSQPAKQPDDQPDRQPDNQPG